MNCRSGVTWCDLARIVGWTSGYKNQQEYNGKVLSQWNHRGTEEVFSLAKTIQIKKE